MVGVLCVGFAALDHVFGLAAMPNRAEKYRAHDFAAVGGGNAANAAVAIARLGGQAQLATRLGDDDIGTAILTGLAREGVDCRATRRYVGLKSGISAILVDADAERMVINYPGSPMPDDCEHLRDALSPACRAVMADPRWEAGALFAFEEIRRNGGAAVLDVDPAPRNPAVMHAATHIVSSAQALRAMTGIDDLAAALMSLRATYAGWLAVTDGPRGVFYLYDNAVRHCPAFPVKAVDTLGAGDVFHGAFALALAEGGNEEHALRFASAAAALKCTHFGGRDGCPTRDELDQFLKVS
jgi:sulfofructose kinase